MLSLFTHSPSTLFSNPHLCLLMLYLWTVAKAASLQENQMDYEKISGILSYFASLYYTQPATDCFPIVSVAFSCTQKPKCVHSSVHAWSVIHHMTAD